MMHLCEWPALALDITNSIEIFQHQININGAVQLYRDIQLQNTFVTLKTKLSNIFPCEFDNNSLSIMMYVCDIFYVYVSFTLTNQSREQWSSFVCNEKSCSRTKNRWMKQKPELCVICYFRFNCLSFQNTFKQISNVLFSILSNRKKNCYNSSWKYLLFMKLLSITWVHCDITYIYFSEQSTILFCFDFLYFWLCCTFSF